MMNTQHVRCRNKFGMTKVYKPIISRTSNIRYTPPPMAKKKVETVKEEPVKKASAKKAAPVKAEAATEKPAKKAAAPKKASTKVVASPTAEITALQSVEPYSLFTHFDVSLFRSGKHFKLYEKFGSHTLEHKGVIGTYFSVWAPNAQYVAVIGNFNYWDKGTHKLNARWDSSGIWEGFIPHVGNGEVYKYFIKSSSGEELEKSDPFALQWELPPRTGSIVTDTFYEWKDQDWMANRYKHNALDKPYSVYEMHVGSWARNIESPDEFLNYRELAAKLVPYIQEMGFTHVEFMPIMEHPYYPSWGYQISGFFAASCRYGSPQDLMFLWKNCTTQE